MKVDQHRTPPAQADVLFIRNFPTPTAYGVVRQTTFSYAKDARVAVRQTSGGESIKRGSGAQHHLVGAIVH